MQNQHDYEKIIPEIIQKLRTEGFFQTLSLKCKEIIQSHQDQNQLIDEVVKHLQEKLPEIKLKIVNSSNTEEEIENFYRIFWDSFLKSFSQYQSEQLGQIRNLIETKIKAKLRELLGENLSPNYSENTRDLSPDSPPQQSLTNPEFQQQNHSSTSGGIPPLKPEKTPSNTSQQRIRLCRVFLTWILRYHLKRENRPSVHPIWKIAVDLQISALIYIRSMTTRRTIQLKYGRLK